MLYEEVNVVSVQVHKRENSIDEHDKRFLQELDR